ncbi:unnamed protein product [Calicophoron daubneyi]|uniref:Uncharacterized protein n=1 Tax=Calicophoron daubneyi TaxID=300641 RepID=A0AAV2TCC8_CALDB
MNSTAKSPGQKFPRRTSVIPTAASFSRSQNEYGCSSRPNLASRMSTAEVLPSSRSDKFRRMSTLFSLDKTRTKDAIIAAFEDPARTEYRRLKTENERLTTLWKQLKGYIEQLQSDYESTRQLDPIRRYKQLQAMIKRTVMHLRLTEVGNAVTESPMCEPQVQGCIVQSEVKEREMEKRVKQLCDNFTVEELGLENPRIRDMNDRLETRIQLIVQSINELDVQYHSMKSENVLKRYVSLRDAVKELVTNSELTDNP